MVNIKGGQFHNLLSTYLAQTIKNLRNCSGHPIMEVLRSGRHVCVVVTTWGYQGCKLIHTWNCVYWKSQFETCWRYYIFCHGVWNNVGQHIFRQILAGKLLWNRCRPKCARWLRDRLTNLTGGKKASPVWIEVLYKCVHFRCDCQHIACKGRVWTHTNTHIQCATNTHTGKF